MRSAFILIFAVLGAFSGTAQGHAAGTREPEGTRKPVIALVMKSLANEFFLTMERGAKAHQSDNADRYDLLVSGIKDERDVAQQIRIVEQMTARRVDAIVIAPADSKALVPVCREAADKGILIVNIDNKFDEAALREKGLRIPFVGPNNRSGAEKVGRYLARSLARGDLAAIIEGIPTAFNAQQRTEGFRTAMHEAGVEIVTIQTGLWEMDKASRVAAAIISEYPDLRALLCGNDNMALGAVAAVKAAGKAGGILIVGFDNISAANTMLKQGLILATADQHADMLAVHGIEYALGIMETGLVPEDQETPVDLVTR